MAKRTLYAVAGIRGGLVFVVMVFLTLAAGLRGSESRAAAAERPPCAACLVLTITPEQAALLPDRLDGLDVMIALPPDAEEAASAALAEVTRKGGRAGLLVDGVGAAPLPPALAAGAARILFDLREVADDAEPAQLAFTVKLRITAARAAMPAGGTIGIGGTGAVLTGLLSRDLGPYVDFLALAGGDPPERSGQELWNILDPAPALTLADALRSTALSDGDRWLWRLPADATAAAALAVDVARAAALFPAGLVPSPAVQIACGTHKGAAYLNPQTLDTVALVPACVPDTQIVVTPPDPGMERLVLSSGGAIVRLPGRGAQDRFAEGVQVVGARSLTVEEIVARHQAAAARQEAAVRELISRGTLTMSFEAPGFPAPIAISAETVLYTAGGITELEQRTVRVNGLEFAGGAVPRLPIIEPERVASPPLAITLTGVYRYRLDGRATISGTPCYVVAFEPESTGRRAGATSLFRGRAWIAMDTFAMIKVAATQTGLRGPIVASEQVDEFREIGAGIWLLARSDVRQMYEGAAHRTPVHRVLSIESHDVNPADFAARRQAAYASDSVMLRDTPQGYRYLQKDRASGAARGAVPAVAARADRVRTLAAGVILDPNISIPLPFAGLSYVDFNLFGTGTQLNAFFGGTYAQLAFSVPSLGGTRWQLAGRAFGIASSYNDRTFVNGLEQYAEDIRQRPAQAAVWLLRPLTPRLTLRVGYDLDYTRFRAGSATARTFAVPADQVAHGARVALDAQRGGWNSSVWWNPARRSGWRAWGPAGAAAYDPAHRDFTRYGASLVRSAVLTPRLVARIEGSWMSGRDLDRFSRYSFGTFDNRLRGYPSALIRYDRGAVARSVLAWAAGKLVRVDGFFDSAAVHDPGFGRGLRNYTGVGGAIEAPAPFGTLLAAEWGYGLRGVNGDGSLGTHVVRVSAYKVF